MGNSLTLRCCIACVLPCGVLDVVRVLHVNGRIDEYGLRITAGEVMKANPKHVLAQPMGDELVKKPSLVHPDTELQKGKIYFLIPTYTLQKQSKAKSKSLQISSSEKCQMDESKTAPETCALRPLAPQRSEPACPRERGSNWLGRRRMDSKRSGSAWKPVLERISEVDDTLQGHLRVST